MVTSGQSEEVIIIQKRTDTDSLPLKLLNACLLIGEIILITLRICYIIAEDVYRKFFPIPEKSVSNEIVLITGAGRGIGRELALQYAALGATVVCWGVSKEKNEDTVNTIAKLGYRKAYFYECDVANKESVSKTAEKVKKDVGTVTILVNNAGVAYTKPLFEQTYSEIENTININMMSHFWTLQAFLPDMIRTNHGHIVANCSVGGLIGLKNGVSYCASKFAIKGMMEALYQELRLDVKCKVKLTTIYPYLVKTDIFKRAQIRFPGIMPILQASDVAREIVCAQRRDVIEVTVPKYMASLNAIGRLFPFSVGVMIYDFFNIHIEE